MYNFNVGKAQEPPPATKKKMSFCHRVTSNWFDRAQGGEVGRGQKRHRAIIERRFTIQLGQFCVVAKGTKKKTKATARTTRPSVTDLGGDVRLLGGFCASSLK